jgi:hypothetical protein
MELIDSIKNNVIKDLSKWSFYMRHLFSEYVWQIAESVEVPL